MGINRPHGPWVTTKLILLIFYVLNAANLTVARKHHMEVQTDGRPYVALSTFGFYTKGHLDVKISELNIDNQQENDLYGLTLDKTTIDQMNPYLDTHQTKCLLEESIDSLQRTGPILFLLLDFKELKVKVQCSPDWKNMHIYPDRSHFHAFRRKRQSLGDSALFLQPRSRRSAPQESQIDEEGKFPSDESVEQPMEQDVKSSSPLAIKQTSEVKAEKAAAPAPVTPEATKKSEKIAQPIEPVKSMDTGYKVSESVDAPLKSQPLPIGDIREPPKGDSNVRLPDVLPRESDESFSEEDETEPKSICNNFALPMTKTVVDGRNFYNLSFAMLIRYKHDEGLYNLYFHACPNYNQPKQVTFDVDIEEKNLDNFLSAGEMPLPPLYFMMSLLFFLSGLFWVFILKKSKHNVYKIHYIMAVLVFLKSLSLMFHSINYHFIEIRGEHVEAWAILYYIAHLLKGAVLFITIVLIGTGWTFIKRIFSEKDKKIFMIVIPLQVLVNVAQIILDESEESDVEFRTWRNIVIFVDLLCCGAILFPIVWSIRHLHEASATDGKAAMNLRKLRLFRQFYIMIVCYIYFTRIIVYLLKMTEAFQYAWLHEMFREMATYVFFVLTGYKFRPSSSDLYFAIADDIDDDDEVEVLTESGLTAGLHRTKALNRNAPPPKTVIIEGNDEERENLITKMESSHEYD